MLIVITNPRKIHPSEQRGNAHPIILEFSLYEKFVYEEPLIILGGTQKWFRRIWDSLRKLRVVLCNVRPGVVLCNARPGVVLCNARPGVVLCISDLLSYFHSNMKFMILVLDNINYLGT